MEKLLRTFPKSVLDKMLDVCWGQWSALGAYATVPPETGKAIDPEALICATMFFGRYDPRLFDEALDWIAANARSVSLDRLKMIARVFGPKCKACLGASLEVAASWGGIPRLASAAARWDEFRLAGREELFLSWGRGKGPGVKDPDPTFLAWGFLRKRPVLRGLSGKPDLGNDANLFLRLRKLFGVTSRASVVGYLLLKGEGNSTRIAKAVHVNQRNAYGILEEMAEGGFLERWTGGREAVFRIDRERWGGIFGAGRGEGAGSGFGKGAGSGFGKEGGVVFVGWADVFSAFQLLLEDWAENAAAYSTPYLASSRLRDIAPGIVRRLAAGDVGYRIPDLRAHRGEDYLSAFAEHIQAYLDHL